MKILRITMLEKYYKYKLDYQGALMHNKFFIFDKQRDNIDGMIQYKKVCDGEFCHKLNISVS